MIRTMKLLPLAALFVVAVFKTPLPAATRPSFFAPPQRSSASLAVKLHPMENVVTGQPVLVTFGLPFTRSSIVETDLITVQVLNGQADEIPAHVSQMTLPGGAFRTTPFQGVLSGWP